MEQDSVNPMIKQAICILGSQDLLAAACDVSQTSVYKWLNNKARISAENALKVESATNGRVKKNDIRPDIFKPT